MIWGLIAILIFGIIMYFVCKLVFGALKKQREYEKKRREIIDYQINQIEKEKEER